MSCVPRTRRRVVTRRSCAGFEQVRQTFAAIAATRAWICRKGRIARYCHRRGRVHRVAPRALLVDRGERVRVVDRPAITCRLTGSTSRPPTSATARRSAVRCGWCRSSLAANPTCWAVRRAPLRQLSRYGPRRRPNRSRPARGSAHQHRASDQRGSRPIADQDVPSRDVIVLPVEVPGGAVRVPLVAGAPVGS